LLLALTTQIFGVDGRFGNLVLHPRLNASFFNENGRATLRRNFRDLRLEVQYVNHSKMSYPDNTIRAVTINGQLQKNLGPQKGSVTIPYSGLAEICKDGSCVIEVMLK
jgi:hypothetical protein